MSRELLIRIALGLAAVGAAVWIARSTHWEEVTQPLPMKGEAARNPYYSLEHLAADIGIRAQEVSSLRSLPPRAVLMVDNLHDDLLHEPLAALQNWVESGGRLILSREALSESAELQTWTAVKPAAPDKPAAASRAPKPGRSPSDGCRPMNERINGAQSAAPLRVCVFAGEPLAYDGDHSPRWSLSDESGAWVIRTPVGLGEVTVFGPWGWIWSNELLRRADDALVFVYGAGLRRGDTLLILTRTRAEPLLALLWRLAAPAILFLLAAALLLIWRNLPRFGPPVPTPAPIRRSLAEQLRANAAFALRIRDFAALRAAVHRALDEAAERHIVGYRTLDSHARAARLAVRTGIDGGAIDAALRGDGGGGANEQRAAITLMELCRRLLGSLATKGDP